MILGENRLPALRELADPRLGEWQDIELHAHGYKRKRLTLADPRLGKTYLTARWARGLANCAELGLERMVVTAPLRVCPTWQYVLDAAGLPVTSVFDETSSVARTRVRRGWSGVLLVNHDKLWPLRDILYRQTQVFVSDEVHHMNSPSSHRGLAARRIAHNAQWVRALTATPAANNKGNLWSPLSMVGATPLTWTDFAERYLVRDVMFPKVIKSIINESELDMMLARYASIIPRDTIFGPDDYQYVRREVTLPPRIAEMYRRLAREWIVDEPFEVVADHTLTRYLRLQQITSGTLLPLEPRDGDYSMKLLHTAKIDAALADLDEIIEAGKKAVVFHRFIPEGYVLVQALQALGVPTFVINGQVNGVQSEAERVAFTEHVGPAVIVVNIGSGGEGISLACAEYALYLSRDFSYIHDKQSRDRVWAPDQPRTVIYYEVPGTIDLTITRTLERKEDLDYAIKRLTAHEVVYGVVA